MRQANFLVITNGDMSQPTVASSAILLEQDWVVSLQAVWSGASPVGTFVVQVSNDMGADVLGSNPNGLGVVNWSDITSSSFGVSVDTGSAPWNLSGYGYKWARILYTSASGTGTLNVRANIKGI